MLFCILVLVECSLTFLINQYINMILSIKLYIQLHNIIDLDYLHCNYGYGWIYYECWSFTVLFHYSTANIIAIMLVGMMWNLLFLLWFWSYFPFYCLVEFALITFVNQDINIIITVKCCIQVHKYYSFQLTALQLCIWWNLLWKSKFYRILSLFHCCCYCNNIDVTDVTFHVLIVILILFFILLIGWMCTYFIHESAHK